MNIFSFRTECEADGKNVSDLILCAGIECTILEGKLVSDDLAPQYKMWAYTMKCKDTEDMEGIKSKMKNCVDNHPQFVDMHRCYQTLAIGDTPNEQWYR